MSRRIARNVVAWIGKAILVKDTSSCYGGVAITKAGGQLRADHIRPRVAIRKKSIGVEDRQRLPGLYGDKSAECPTADDSVQHGIHRTANQAVLSDWNVEND